MTETEINWAKLAPDVCKRLWGEPNENLSSINELRWGSKGSKSLKLDKGVWRDYERDEGGGCIDLIERETGRKGPEAIAWLHQEGLLQDALHTNGWSFGHANGSRRRSGRVVARYDYVDELGDLLSQVERKEFPFEPGQEKPHKTFLQRRRANPTTEPPGTPVGKRGKVVGPDGWVYDIEGVRRVPYRLPELIEALSTGAPVFLVEGEKKVEALRQLGVPATCSMGGSKKWQRDWNQHFEGGRIIFLPDNDQAGADHVNHVAPIISEVCSTVKVLELPGLCPKGDVVDWLQAGGTATELYELANTIGREWRPPEPEPDAVEDTGWRDRLVMARQGVPYPNEANFMLEVENDPAWRGVFSYSVFSHSLLLMKPIPRRHDDDGPEGGSYPRAWTDEDTILATRWFQLGDYPKASSDKVSRAIGTVAWERNRIHEVRDYLDSLRWDGTPRLDTWLQFYCGVHVETEDDAAWVQAVGSKWMIAAAARIYEPGCQVDTMLVLEGPQGAMKTSLLRLLAGPAWFSESLPGDLHHKDAAIHVQGVWIVEMSELSQIGRNTIETLKSFLSRRNDKFRPPFAKCDVMLPRQAIFAGTTNRDDYLKDSTGNRRFWPVKVGTIHLDAVAEDRDQLWAEAVHRYRQGEKWWHTDDRLKAIAIAQQEARQEGDVWDDLIRQYLENRIRSGKPHTTSRQVLVDALLMHEAAAQRPVDQKRVTHCLERLKWRKDKKYNYGMRWVPINQPGTEKE